MNPEQQAALRERFPPHSIGILPKPTRKENAKGKCNECGGWHGLPAVHVDYVGHAAVRSRLCEVDPEWTWEPMAYTAEGLPKVYEASGSAVLWIRLTVAGVTKPGVGTVSTGSFDVEKQLISDALRNAAMSFGVAVDLWSKEELTELGEAPPPASSKGGRRAGASSVSPAPRPAWAGLTKIVEAGQNEDGSWTPLCPWCASDVLDQKGKKSKGGKDLPAWACTNDMCGGGKTKDDGSHWPWASFDPHFFEVTGDIQDLIEEHVGGNPNEVTVVPPIQGPTLWLWESLAAVIKNEDERRTVIRAVMDERGIDREDLTQEIANLVFTDAQHAWWEANPKEKPF